MADFVIEDGVLTFGDDIEIIQTESFGERMDIEKIVFSPSIRHIGGAAFAGCENLREVSFAGEKNLETIGDGAFTLCSRLSSFDFNEGLESIGELAFWETALEEVDIPKGVKSIGDNAFWGNKRLRTFNCFDEECRIGLDVLGDCDSLREGYVAAGYPSLKDYNQADELIYTLLWLSRNEGHKKDTVERARDFVRNQEMLIMEKILARNNTAAMTGLVKLDLLDRNNVDRYIEEASRRDLLEITNLLLEMKRNRNTKIDFGEFEL